MNYFLTRMVAKRMEVKTPVLTALSRLLLVIFFPQNSQIAQNFRALYVFRVQKNNS